MRACLALVVLSVVSAGCWSTYKSKPVAFTGESTVSMLDRHNLPTSTRNDLHKLELPFSWVRIWEVTAESGTDSEPSRHLAEYNAMPVHWESDLLLEFELPPDSVVRPGYVYITGDCHGTASGFSTTVEIDLPDEGGFTLAIAKSRDEQLIPAIVLQERLRMMKGGRPPSVSAGPLRETPADCHFSLVYRTSFMNNWRKNEGMIHLARRFEVEASTYVALVEWRRSQAPVDTRESGVVDGCLTILNGIRAIEPEAHDALETE